MQRRSPRYAARLVLPKPRSTAGASAMTGLCHRRSSACVSSRRAHSKLMRIAADLSLDKAMLDVLAKKSS